MLMRDRGHAAYGITTMLRNETSREAAHWDKLYGEHDRFNERDWLYARFLQAITNHCQLRPGSTILDVGCGQGQLVAVLVRLGFRVVGIDLSHVGVCQATVRYGPHFAQASAYALPFRIGLFDLVLSRSCSAWRRDAEDMASMIATLSAFVRPGGKLVLSYNTDLSGETVDGWPNPPVNQLRPIFPRESETFFVNKLAAVALGSGIFDRRVERLTLALHGRLRVKRGGEFVAIVPCDANPAG